MLEECNIGHYHLLFLYMLIGLYMITPFLKLIADRSLVKYFLLLAFIFALLIPQLVGIAAFDHEGAESLSDILLDALNLKFVLGYSGYFILGYLLNKRKISKKQETIIYILGLCGALYTMLATAFFSKRLEEPTQLFYRYLSPNVCAMAAVVFVFAKKHLNKYPKSKTALNRLLFLSKCSFGVYLIHPAFIEVLSKALHIDTMSFNPILSVPLLSLFIFAISFAASAVMNKIPIVKKWLV